MHRVLAAFFVLVPLFRPKWMISSRLEVRSVITHFLHKASMSSLGCMRIKCCLKLSSRGHSFEALAQPGAKHLYILDLPTCLPCTDFSWR